MPPKKKSSDDIIPSGPMTDAARRSAAEVDLVYEMQRWPRHLFRAEAAEDGQLAESLQLRDEKTWPPFVRELFGRLYGVGTRKREEVAPGNEWAEELHAQCDSLPEWTDLQARVMGDPWKAGVSAGVAASILSPRVPEIPQEVLAALETELELIDELMNKDGKRRASAKLLKHRGDLQNRVAKAKAANASAMTSIRAGNGFATRSGLRSAAQQALGALDEIDAAANAFGAGLGMGHLQPREIAKHMAQDDRLRRIALIAGRLRVQAIDKQRTKVTPGRTEIQDIELGSDPQRLLPSELLNLTSPDTETLLHRRLMENGAMQYRLQGRDTKTRGPILFLIDASGSMYGSRSEWAAACALAIMEIARRQKRKFAVMYFDDGIVGSYWFNDPNQTKFEDLLPVLSLHSGGGTHIATALDHAADVVTGKVDANVVHTIQFVHQLDDGSEVITTEHVEKLRAWSEGSKADVILVTDGDDYSDVGPPANRIKESGASLYTIAIQCEPQPGLVQHSTEVVRMGHGNLEHADAKMDGVFSI